MLTFHPPSKDRDEGSMDVALWFEAAGKGGVPMYAGCV